MSGRGWWVVLCLALVSAAARGQTEEPSRTGAREQEPHGWVATSALGGGGAAALLHFPPRLPAPGVHGSESGVSRQIQTLAQQPGHIASWGRRVYLLYSQPGKSVDVFSVRVAPTSVGAYWAADPIVGATAELSLRLEGAGVADATGTRLGLAVLARDDARWRLWVLGTSAWEPIEMPPGLASSEEGWVRFVTGSPSVELLAHYEGRTVHWALADRQTGRWEATPLADAGRWPESAVRACFASAGDVCLALDSGERGIEAWSLGPTFQGRLAGVSLAGNVVAATPLEWGSRLAVLALVRNDEAEPKVEPVEQWELVEVSMTSGRELYRGTPRSGAPITGSDVRWLSLGMVALVVAVLFYLLRPTPTGDGVSLPEGYALAEPGRRIAAGLLDWVLIGASASIALDLPIHHVLLVTPLLESTNGFLTLIVLLGAGAAYGTSGEWLCGRTVGKALARCEVISLVGGRRRVGLMRCGARNVFKWALAPWALLGLAAEDGRHRGDRVAGAAVVVRVEPDAEGRDADGDG